MVKNEEKTGLVSAIGFNGEGIIKDEGYVIFVPFSLQGEKIRYRVLKVSSNIVYGKLLEVLTPAEERVRPKCPVFGKCGGCQLQHLEYSHQLKLKENNIYTCFRKIAGLDVDVKPTVQGDSCLRYRNKLQLPVRFNGKETVLGFYAENSHRVVPIDDCIINPIWTADLIKAVKSYILKNDIKGYDETDGSGMLKEVTAKELNGNVIITFVTSCDALRAKEDLIDILKNNFPYNFSLFHNVNKSNNNVIYGDKFYLLYGKPEYSGEMLGIKYTMGVRSFMQVNPTVCAKMYYAVKNAVGNDPEQTIIDAYSGTGLMTAMLAEYGKKVIGIEIIPEAVDIANNLAINNSLADKVTNYLGKCEEIMPDIIKKERLNTNKIVIVLDPPRKGCEQAVIDAVINSQANKIVYISCKPSTLARDVGLICGSLQVVDGKVVKSNGADLRYKIESVRPFDMFSMTKHIETVCLLTKKVQNRI